MRSTDVLIIGAGSAGLSAAASLKQNGVGDILVVDREEQPGGILMQCIHNGFGLHRFGEELTGPEYAQKFVDICAEEGVEILLKSSVVDIVESDGSKVVIVLSEEQGLIEVKTKSIILAMGCRERNRGNINIPGTRPAGVMTAGLAQKLVNIEGYLPGKDIVIVGSGDIGLIMARRMTLEGASVKAVLEIQPYPGGLQRNIVQCLDDFGIPLYTSHAVSNVHGKNRVEAFDVSKLNSDGQFEYKETIKCDTLMLSVGLVPENELSLTAGVELHPVTNGPKVDSNFMTSVEGIFACGNVLHVHDLVDFVSEESAACGLAVSEYLQKLDEEKSQVTNDEIIVRCGNMVRYTVPMTVKKGEPALIRLRCVAPAKDVKLKVNSSAGEEIYSKKLRHVLPSEMLAFEIENIPENCDSISVEFEV